MYKKMSGTLLRRFSATVSQRFHSRKMSTSSNNISALTNHGAKNVPYFIPQPPVKAGTAYDPQPNGKEIPKLFKPLTIKGLTLQNRIAVSPMCQYSAKNGVVTPYHFAHYGAFALHGPGTTIVECASVSDEGRISPEDVGIWTDEQALKLKEIVDFYHSQNQTIGIQIGHAGRKGSTVAMWLSFTETAPKEVGGFDDKIVAPSAIPFASFSTTPNELTNAHIKEIVKKFGDAARRATQIAGFDFVEIHAAHGYLLNEFLGEVSNKRTDEYGGSFENRIRIHLEIIEAVKKNIPKDQPIFLRLSAVDNVDNEPLAWTLEDTIKFSKIIVDHGVDVIDVSSGGNNSNQNARGFTPGIHAPYAKAIKEALGDKVIVALVGGLHSSEMAEEYLNNGTADVALVGRGFLRNPGLVWSWADNFGIRLHQSSQYSRAGSSNL